jgi:hypothetical protein
MYVWAPVIAGALLSVAGAVLFYTEFASEMPHSISNETEWLALADSVSAQTHASSLSARLGVLLALHALHIYACLPMLHLTKVLYGMWLGLIWGWLSCCAWELFLFAMYLMLMPRRGSHVLLVCTQRSRTSGNIFFDNVMMAMSSFPLHVSAALVLNADVSLREFFLANALVTAVLSLKNVWCGSILANSPEPSTLVVLAVLLTLSTFLPTAATVYITGKGLYVAADYVADSVAEAPNPRPACGTTKLGHHDPSQELDNIIVPGADTATPCAEKT